MFALIVTSPSLVLNPAIGYFLSPKAMAELIPPLLDMLVSSIAISEPARLSKSNVLGVTPLTIVSVNAFLYIQGAVAAVGSVPVLLASITPPANKKSSASPS